MRSRGGFSVALRARAFERSKTTRLISFPEKNQTDLPLETGARNACVGRRCFNAGTGRADVYARPCSGRLFKAWKRECRGGNRLVSPFASQGGRRAPDPFEKLIGATNMQPSTLRHRNQHQGSVWQEAEHGAEPIGRNTDATSLTSFGIKIPQYPRGPWASPGRGTVLDSFPR